MCSGVLKCYGSHITDLFRFVGSRHMQSLGLPDLSLPSMSTKLLIHTVTSLTGLITLD